MALSQFNAFRAQPIFAPAMLTCNSFRPGVNFLPVSGNRFPSHEISALSLRAMFCQQLQQMEQMMQWMTAVLSMNAPSAPPSAPAGMPDLNKSFGNGSPVAEGPVTANLERLVSTLPAARRDAARRSFPSILAECKKENVTDKAQVAYILATATHESNAGANMEEIGSGAKYNGRASLGNTRSGDGERYKGRGFVQLTGRRNYSDWSRRLGVDLVNHPERAKDPDVAAKILVGGMKSGSFTGRKMEQHLGGGRQDFEGARAIINGKDKAGPIADLARKLMAAL